MKHRASPTKLVDTDNLSRALNPTGGSSRKAAESPKRDGGYGEDSGDITLRQVVADINSAVGRQFENGVSAPALVRARAAAIDTVMLELWNHHGLDCNVGACLVAVGGYGRGELHPGSDIDLLVLMPESADTEAEERVSGFITQLWDLGLDIGQSVRTVAECIARAKDDLTIATNLMESRILTGDEQLYSAMREGTNKDAIWPSAEFFAAKSEEQDRRYERYHGTGYNLEPNVKEGPGGLRDIQMIGWVVTRHYGAEKLHDLVSLGFLTEREYRKVQSSQDFLWAVRMALHLLAGRKQDRLLFEYQREIANRFGFEDSDANLAVEHFMKRYYRTIMDLSRLNEMLLQLFQERFLEEQQEAEVVAINKRFRTRGGFLEVTNDRVFKRYPFALLELFLILQQNPQIKGVRASTIRLVRDNRDLIDEGFRHDIRCRSLFLEILRQPRGITHEFRRMHTYGVLGAYLPNFEAIIGLMQFDLFHAYTVDEHILFTVRNLRQFFVPEHRHELPHCSDVAPHIQKPELLYLAGLFHDIAKGRQGDHSDLGAHEAIEFCQHHGISSYDAQVIAWLVNHHLVMSTTAQRQDISDPDVVRRFAEFVGDSARLDYLYMLTVADIRATNPELWNEWRDALLWRLYKATQAVLRRGIESDASTDEQARECQREAREQLFKEGLSSTQVEDLWDTLNDDYFVRSSPDDVIWQTRQVLDHDPAAGTLVAVRTERGNTAVFIYEEDKNYLFAAATTLFERLGLTVLDARVFTSEDGMSFDTYIVREADGEPITERSRELEIRQTLVKRLKEPEKAIYPVNRVPRRRLKSFPIPPTVMFQTDEPTNRTVMEVITADRPGLLSRIGWALAGSAANVKNAKIATYGERAEDIFFLSNAAGEPLTPDEQSAVQEKILKALQPSPSKSGTKSAA